MFMYVWLHEPVCVHGDQEKMLGIPVYHSLTILFEAEFLPQTWDLLYLG